MSSEKRYIFDSHALLKFFQKEKGYEKVLNLLKTIKKHSLAKYINAINLGEIIYIIMRFLEDFFVNGTLLVIVMCVK